MFGEGGTNLLRSSQEAASLILIYMRLEKGTRQYLKCIVSFWRELSFLRSISLWDLFLHEVKNMRMA